MKDERVYLIHAVDSIDAIQSHTVDGRDAFFADPKTQDAVIRKTVDGTLGIACLPTHQRQRIERFIQTLTHRWAYGAIYGSSTERTAALHYPAG